MDIILDQSKSYLKKRIETLSKYTESKETKMVQNLRDRQGYALRLAEIKERRKEQRKVSKKKDHINDS